MTKAINIGKTLTIVFHLLLMAGAIFTLSVSNASAGQGTWDKQDFKIKGSWSIEQRADGNYLVLSDDFKTRSAPDLKFFLSKKKFSDINGSNATDGATLISEISSSKGGQSYKIPSNINVSDYESLVLHCEQYSKLWASTSLK